MHMSLVPWYQDTVPLYNSKLSFMDLVGLKFWDRIWRDLASSYTNLVLNSPGDYGNIVKTGSRVILNLYGDPRYKNQTSEKRYKVPTTALPPMRVVGSLIQLYFIISAHLFAYGIAAVLGKYCTFVCGTLFGRIKLIKLYPPKQSSTYKSAILAEY